MRALYESRDLIKKLRCSGCKTEHSSNEFGYSVNASYRDYTNPCCRVSANMQSHKWKHENPERRQQTVANYYTANKAARLNYGRKWRKTNQARANELGREQRRKRRARERDATLVPFTQAELIGRMSVFGFKCYLCKTGPFEHVDHVKPLSKGGPHILANLRPACQKCNQQKSNRWEGVKWLLGNGTRAI